MNETLERWHSRRAFILAVTGAAVGLGNIWRFPYMTGENGGSAFLLLYILFVVVLGLPMMMAEILIGRAGRRSPMQALAYLASEAGVSPHWRWVGLFGALTVFFILSFYSVVSGWSIEYLVDAVNGGFVERTPAQIGSAFDAFLADPLRMTFNHTLFMLLTMSVVAAGVSNGLEKLNNVMMPLLYVILIVLGVTPSPPPAWCGDGVAVHTQPGGDRSPGGAQRHGARLLHPRRGGLCADGLRRLHAGRAESAAAVCAVALLDRSGAALGYRHLLGGVHPRPSTRPRDLG
nr:sodium-dependent transporter [Salinicola tamaricis]